MQSNSLGLPLPVTVLVSQKPTNPISLIVKTDFLQTGSSIGLYSDYEEYGAQKTENKLTCTVEIFDKSEYTFLVRISTDKVLSSVKLSFSLYSIYPIVHVLKPTEMYLNFDLGSYSSK